MSGTASPARNRAVAGRRMAWYNQGGITGCAGSGSAEERCNPQAYLLFSPVMAETSGDRSLESQEGGGIDSSSGPGSPPAPPQSYARYLKLIDRVKKGVAIGMAICGPGLVLCVRRDDYLRLTLRQESGLWAWGVGVFGIGVLACLVATLALVVEHLARPAPLRFAMPSVFTRSLVILVTVGAVCLGMVVAYGIAQGIGATIGGFLVLAAVLNHGIARAIAAILAVILIGWTVLSTQSAYQYAQLARGGDCCGWM